MLKRVFISLFVILACSFSMVAQDVKFGYLDSREILLIMPESIEAQKAVDAETTKLENELNKMREELNKKFTAFQQEQDSLSESIKTLRMKEINDLDQRTQNFYGEAREALQNLQMEKMRPVEEKFQNAIKYVGDTNGFFSIIDVNAALYVSTTKMTDVSSLVKARLGIK